MVERSNNDLLEWTAAIVASHVKGARLDVAELPGLISSIHSALKSLSSNVPVERMEPAVPVRRSVMPDYIICLEDGRKLKMLKRHLSTAYNMTPEEYREKWGLPADYPMVAPNYAKQRSKLAKEIGLGTRARRGKG